MAEAVGSRPKIISNDPDLSSVIQHENDARDWKKNAVELQTATLETRKELVQKIRNLEGIFGSIINSKEIKKLNGYITRLDNCFNTLQERINNDTLNQIDAEIREINNQLNEVYFDPTKTRDDMWKVYDKYNYRYQGLRTLRKEVDPSSEYLPDMRSPRCY